MIGPGRHTACSRMMGVLLTALVTFVVLGAVPVAAAPDPRAEEIYAALDIEEIKARYVVLVDVSTSMKGELYDAVRTGLLRFSAALAPADQLTLMTVGETTTKIWNGPVGDSPAAVVDRLPPVPDEPSTDLGVALETAVGALEQSRSETPVAGVVLMTDGRHEPPRSSRYLVENGHAWLSLADRAARLPQKVTAYAVQLPGASGAEQLRTVFPGAVAVDVAPVGDLTRRLQEPKEAVRASKARVRIAEELAAGFSVEWPAAITLDPGENRRMVRMRPIGRRIPVEISGLTIKSRSADVVVEAPNGPFRIAPGGYAELPLTFRWPAGERSWWPYKRVIRQFDFDVAADLHSPWTDVLGAAEAGTPPSKAAFSAPADANLGSGGQWLGVLATAALVGVLLWRRRRSVQQEEIGTLIASTNDFTEPGGSIPVWKAKTRPFKGTELGVPGSGSVVGPRRSDHDKCVITYKRDAGTPKKAACLINGWVDIDGVRFEWVPRT